MGFRPKGEYGRRALGSPPRGGLILPMDDVVESSRARGMLSVVVSRGGLPIGWVGALVVTGKVAFGVGSVASSGLGAGSS